ncbi:FAD-binding protein [Streptomonospora litoralis]|uniref:Putative oxidoreductase ORF5 in fasciation locus n=1 Tax=Streptomonospora litoralis TaxID=2498135 RepID=A0A4V0ZJW6_9ACTN|nr:FAD-binding protein [Streptomonospora litoralis]QBI54912.1 putative oxidoreductase ORF5 in fasciation locus [Streptomonospora litoralis]
MTVELSRRNVLTGMALTAVGWSVSSQSWAVADTRGSDVVPLPELDGRVETSASATSGFGHDFGRMITGDPWGVLRPGSVRDIQKIVRYARKNELKVAVNGRSGTGDDLESHSSYGQALVPGGIAIDARGLSKILDVDSERAVVEAGVTWAQLTDAALEKGLTPPALTDYLHLSVGGTLSVGGIGGTVREHGLQVDTVESVDVVTGEGRLEHASPWRNADLFYAVLAGGGQCGIIVRATVKMQRAPERALMCSLFYTDRDTWMADSERIMRTRRFDAQAGEMLLNPEGTGWMYKIEGVAFHKEGKAPDTDRLLRGLRDDRGSADIQKMSYRDYAFRLDPYEAYLKDAGYWKAAKPWLSLFLPASKTDRFLREAERELDAADIGAGFLLVYPYKTRKITRPLAVQPDEREGYLFDLLRFPAPDGSDIEGMLRQNRRLHDTAVRMGAKRYLVGAIPDMSRRDWREHFGHHYWWFRFAKRRHDPDNVLTPGQGFFG